MAFSDPPEPPSKDPKAHAPSKADEQAEKEKPKDKETPVVFTDFASI